MDVDGKYFRENVVQNNCHDWNLQNVFQNEKSRDVNIS